MIVDIYNLWSLSPLGSELLIVYFLTIGIEHTRNDRYWADGGDGKGKNMLGVVLMETRTKIASMTPEQIAEEVAKARGATVG